MFCTAKGKEQTIQPVGGERRGARLGGGGGGGYLDGGDVERRGDAKDGHDNRLVLLVDEDLHLSDVLFSRHLRDVLVGHVGLPGPEGIHDERR